MIGIKQQIVRTGIAYVIVSLVLCPSAAGQDHGLQIRTAPPSSIVDAGVHWIQEGHLEKAVAVLRPLVERQPDATSSRHGAAAYWLGRAYEGTGRTEDARKAWLQGIRAHADPANVSIRLADAFLSAQSPASMDQTIDAARSAYRRILDGVGSAASPEEAAILRRRVAQIRPLLPEPTASDVYDGPPDAATGSFHEGGGTALQTWWRRQDPYPATRVNERLDEHLRRLVTAQTQYACPSRLSGLDDRGLIYLRLGSPAKTHSVTFSGRNFFREVVRFGVGVRMADFPENEFWLYPQIDRSAYYLFEKNHRCFQTGVATDLLPRKFRQRRGTSDRGLNIAYSAMMALRYIYADLARWHADFGNRYADVARYVNWQETRAAVAEAREATGGGGGSGRSVGAGVGQERQVFASRQFGIAPPDRFVANTVQRSDREDRRAADRRAAAVPPHRSTVGAPVNPLPVAVRPTRFLTEDGRTRTDIAWGLPTRALRQDGTASDVDVTLTGVQYGQEYRRETETARTYRIPAPSVREDRLLHPSALSLPATDRLRHLALQWSVADGPGAHTATGTPKQIQDRVAVVRVDSIAPLRATPDRLEMSDVQVRALLDTSAAPADWLDASRPYPFASIPASNEILLYVELYHLMFGADDRTRYQIEYTVEGKTGGRWQRLGAQSEGGPVSTSATFTGSSRRTNELISLNLSSSVRTVPSSVRVTVRVTDLVGRTDAERSVEFDIAP